MRAHSMQPQGISTHQQHGCVGNFGPFQPQPDEHADGEAHEDEENTVRGRDVALLLCCHGGASSLATVCRCCVRSCCFCRQPDAASKHNLLPAQQQSQSTAAVSAAAAAAGLPVVPLLASTRLFTNHECCLAGQQAANVSDADIGETAADQLSVICDKSKSVRELFHGCLQHLHLSCRQMLSCCGRVRTVLLEEGRHLCLSECFRVCSLPHAVATGSGQHATGVPLAQPSPAATASRREAVTCLLSGQVRPCVTQSTATQQSPTCTLSHTNMYTQQ